MDGLDARILRELIWGQTPSPLALDLRLSFGVIARKLAADEGTVRNRVRGYHESGFIRGWRTILNPTLFGGGEIAVWLEVGEGTTKDEVTEAARLLPGVTLINTFHGRGMGLVLRYRDEAEMRREVGLLLRFARAEWRVIGKMPYPLCDLRLSAADRAVLRSLREAPRKPASAISRELGLSTRTVRRRLQRLIDCHAVFAFPVLDPKALTGTLMASLFVTFPADRKSDIDRAIASHLDEYLWYTLHTLPFAADGYRPSAHNLFLPNLATAHDVLRWAHDLPGVAQCRLELFEDIEARLEVFDDELEALHVKG